MTRPLRLGWLQLPTAMLDPLGIPLDWLSGSARLAAALPTGPNATELANRLAAFRHYRAATMRSDGDDIPLEVRLDRVLEQGPYRGLWAMEGLGFTHGERLRSEGEAVAAQAFRVAPPPLRARIPLHTGLGLCLARRAVHDLRRSGRTGDAAAAIEATLQHLRDDCRRLSAPGCEWMAFEALGLVARQLLPTELWQFDRCLASWHDESRSFFWHGVGRALYFTPSRLMSSAGACLSGVVEETPDEVARRNALAGLAWAVTLVNVRHPRIVESLLHRRPEGLAADAMSEASVSHGIASALLLWRTSHGEDETLRAFLGHRAAEPMRERWRSWVGEPARQALDRWPEMERAGELQWIFRCPGERTARSQDPPPPLALDRVLDGIFSRAIDALRPEPRRRATTSTRS